MRQNIILSVSLFAFIAGFVIWWKTQPNALEERARFLEYVPFKTDWTAEEILEPVEPPTIPLPQEFVVSVDSSGVLTLSSGGKLRLAGIEPNAEPESGMEEMLRFIKNRIERRSIHFDLENEVPFGDEPLLAYVYARMPPILPEKIEKADLVRWSLNVELLKLGLVKFDAKVPIRYLKYLQGAEEKAKARGAGLWKGQATAVEAPAPILS